MSRIRVLMIDDDPDEGLYVKDILSEAKDIQFYVDVHLNPDSGLSALQANLYDVILLDQRLGRTKGLDWIPEIRKINPSIPIIVVSGFDNKDLAAEAKAAGASDYISKKSITPELLERMIMLVMSSTIEFERPITPLVATSSGNWPIFQQLIDIQRESVKATAQQTAAINRQSDLLQGVASKLDGLKDSNRESFTTLNGHIQAMHNDGMSHVDGVKSSIEQGLAAQGDKLLGKIDEINMHWTLRVLGWVKENKTFSVYLAVGLVFFIMLVILASQTIPPEVLNKILGSGVGK